jgi:hypothetical protein
MLESEVVELVCLERALAQELADWRLRQVELLAIVGL